MKKALITGITGQDGSYLAEFLLEKGYEVHGIIRRASVSNTTRIDHLEGQIKLHNGDLTDSTSLIRIIGQVMPDEIYNLAAQSHVQVSFDVPEYSGDVDAIGVHGQGDVYVVVDEEGDTVGMAEGFDVFCLVQETGLVQVLLPELEEGHAAVQALLHDLVQGPAVQPVPVGDGVEQ